MLRLCWWYLCFWSCLFGIWRVDSSMVCAGVCEVWRLGSGWLVLHVAAKQRVLLVSLCVSASRVLYGVVMMCVCVCVEGGSVCVVCVLFGCRGGVLLLFSFVVVFGCC